MSSQPIISDDLGTHHFACSAIGLQAVIIDSNEKILLLSSPSKNKVGKWQVVSGALKAGETLIDGILREVREEIGGNVKVRPLGVTHAHTFHNDNNVRFMVGIYFLFAYEGGEIQPDDDMKGSQYRWWSIDAMEKEEIKLFIPRGEIWILKRSLELFRVWKNQSVSLQLPLP